MAKCVDCVRPTLPFLKKIYIGGGATKKEFEKNNRVAVLSEICENLREGNLQLTPTELKHFKKAKKLICGLSDSKLSESKKVGLLTQPGHRKALKHLSKATLRQWKTGNPKITMKRRCCRKGRRRRRVAGSSRTMLRRRMAALRRKATAALRRRRRRRRR